MPDTAAANPDIATPELMKAISDAFNSRDVDRIVSHFTEDATFDFTSLGGPFARGRREIVEFFETVITPSATWIWHPLSNPVITLDGDRAKAIWMLHAVTLGKTPDARPHHTLGRYYDEYVRTPDGWRQSVFVFKKELEYDQ